jgi:tRNA A-37 threonylcarbamoyl transferase component Bud32
MASERVTQAVAYLRTGSRDLAPLREMGLTADDYEDLLASLNWEYQTASGMKDAVQSLAAKQRAQEGVARNTHKRGGRADESSRYGKWDIERELSPGGQANTFLVRDRTSTDGRLYVLKALKNPKRLERFADEVRAATRLDHPNIVRVVDADLTADRPYLVTDYCEGGALDEVNLRLRSILERLRMFRLICRAVAHAHDQRVIHRDLKPANIFLRGDRLTPVVGDFGLCFLTDKGERLTLVEEAVGARWYMAPELEDGRSNEVGTWSDVYSLGKVLSWMMAGRVFNREKHREAAYDLTRETESADIFFVYDVLEAAVVADHQRRLQTAPRTSSCCGGGDGSHRSRRSRPRSQRAAEVRLLRCRPVQGLGEHRRGQPHYQELRP